MDELTLLNALSLGEEIDWEVKAAKGGLPGNLWQTYSAMANTDGGTIVLGARERDGAYRIEELVDPTKLKQDFWNLVNNRQKVNVNLLTNDDVYIQTAKGKPVIVIHVPRASRRQRPIYVGQNPLDGTYRRFQEGDYKCSPDEVGRMLADQSEEPADSVILEHFTFKDLDSKSIQQYRNRFSARSPSHPWLAQPKHSLLERLGAWRRDRQTGREGITVAGLLMFGNEEAIRDATAIPQYNVDYRERLSDDPEVRWTDRITIDGTWVGNVFQFYQRVIPRLFADLKVPFQLGPDLYRKDETVVHEAIREAFVNALIHADYRGMGGIVVEKLRDRIEMSNPGSLLLSIDQILAGGVSECRNKSLQLMFQQIGGGEKAGSGIDRIRQGWASQKWRSPRLWESLQPDRVHLILSMVSLLPEDSLKRLRKRFGKRLERLDSLETQALVTAEVEAAVSNSRLREICEDHPSELTRVLQRLVRNGFLEQHGQKRGAFYRLSSGAPHISKVNSPHNQTGSPHKKKGSPRTDSIENNAKLLAVAQVARERRRLPPAQMVKTIVRLCDKRFLTFRQLGTLLARNPESIRDRFLTRLVKQGELRARFPGEPNHPDQAYTASKKRSRKK